MKRKLHLALTEISKKRSAIYRSYLLFSFSLDLVAGPVGARTTAVCCTVALVTIVRALCRQTVIESLLLFFSLSIACRYRRWKVNYWRVQSSAKFERGHSASSGRRRCLLKPPFRSWRTRRAPSCSCENNMHGRWRDSTRRYTSCRKRMQVSSVFHTFPYLEVGGVIFFTWLMLKREPVGESLRSYNHGVQSKAHVYKIEIESVRKFLRILPQKFTTIQ